MEIIEGVFWLSCAAVVHAYFGYPLSLMVLSLLSRKNVARDMSRLPRVTFILTVHNEEKRIGDKLKNTLKLDYPADHLQVLVASDGSTDKTNSIVHEYHERGVQLLEMKERRGKEYAQKEAVLLASGEILVFSDVATLLDSNGLQNLVRSFSDLSVGCVSSEDKVLRGDGEATGEGLYVKYEMWLRRLESQVGSVVGLSGSLFAARREVCDDFAGDMQSDFRTVMNSVRRGLRAVSDSEATGYYLDNSDPKKEWGRKVRTIVRGLTVFFQHLEFLNVARYGPFSYQLACHKLLRWLVPLCLIAILMTSLWLARSGGVYLFILFAELLFYFVAIAGLLSANARQFLFVRIPVFFVSVNASILVAWWKYLSGERIVTWSPTVR